MLSHDDCMPLPLGVDKTQRPKRGRDRPRISEFEAHWEVESGQCIRCGVIARCERAHIIDWAGGGLDDLQNMVPLCYRCHKAMPPFWPGQEDRALAWLAAPDYYTWLERIVEALRVQYPEEWAAAEAEDTPEAAELVARLPIDFAQFPQVKKLEPAA